MVLKLYVGTKFHKNGQKLWKSRNLIPLRYFKSIYDVIVIPNSSCPLTVENV